ncbi:phosphate/phosphite/phosphonate ABC transporter substrate-binding protein [Myceligenerans crystallogenes]|uniref:phosphate/phosphite/phosphonate ABC transporter substrate-binding protein n=1 Tax=Myceligenerans crystallogenes TaxID=316335 RepID=UPI0031D369E0
MTPVTMSPEVRTRPTAPARLVRLAAGLAVCAFAAGTLGACATAASQAADTVCPADGIRYGVQPQGNPAELELAYAGFAAALSDELDCPVEVKVFEDPAAVVAALDEGTIQIVHLTPVGYAVVSRTAGATPVATFSRPNGNMATYKSAIWVPADSGIAVPGDLAGHTLALGKQGTTQGDILPRKALADARIPLGEVGVTYTGGQQESLAALVNGEAEAAQIDSQTMAAAVAAGEFEPDAHRMIWESGAVPSDPIVVPDGSGEAFVTAVEAALLNLEPDPVGKVGAKIGLAPGGRLVGIDDIAYTELGALVDSLSLTAADL